jgi:hypothetical protein
MGHRDETRTLSATELSSRLQGSQAVFLDVREYPEYAEAHVEGARCVPLGDLRRNPSLAGEGGEVLLICRTGGAPARPPLSCETRAGSSPSWWTGGWRRGGAPDIRHGRRTVPSHWNARSASQREVWCSWVSWHRDSGSCLTLWEPA